ncbi:MAG: mannitol-1-phosphate 5-dehydrogenase [Psittacicella sp.]
MKALHFGAGNIGRGFIGKLLADSGINVTFADVNTKVIDLLNDLGQYNVRIVDEAGDKLELVKGVSGILSTDFIALTEAVKEASIITTAVGANILAIIAKPLAKALEARIDSGILTTLNIIACENMLYSGTTLKKYVFEHLSEEYKEKVEECVGFVDSAVDRIVPPAPPAENDPLQVTVELFSEWIVDSTQFRGEIPQIKGMELTDNLIAFIERKLFTLNTGHATTAYFGSFKRINLIKDAILDEEVFNQVLNTMRESGAVLVKRYNFDPAVHEAYIQKIIKRFKNPFLLDEVTRVGRDPVRKLGANDRLVKPLLGTIEYGLNHDYLLKAIAITLHFRNEEDPAAKQVADIIEKDGILSAIKQLTSLTDEVILEKIVNIYNNL